MAPPHGFEPQSSHSKCDILPLDEGGMPSYAMVRPAGFEPASPRLKGEHPGPPDEGRIGAGSEDRTHTTWLEAKNAPQYAIPALIWRRVESTILTGEPADRLAGDAGHPPS